MVGWQYGLFILAIIWLSSSSIGTQKTSQEKTLIGSQDGALTEFQNKTLIRRKRWVGTFIQVGGIVYGITTTGLSIGDYVTDGAIYYPSINDAKNSIRNSTDWIKSKTDFLERLRRDYKETYETYANTKLHVETYQKAQSVVIKHMKHEAFTLRRNTYLNGLDHAKNFEEYGFQFIDESYNRTFPISQGFLQGLYWTGVSTNLIINFYAATKLIENYRLTKIIRDQRIEVRDLLSGAHYSGKQYPPKRVSTAPAKVGRIRRLGRFIKKKFIPKIPKAFRSRNSLLRYQVDHNLNEPPSDSFASNKVANTLSLISFALNIVTQVLSVLGAKAKKAELDYKAKMLEKKVDELKNVTKEWPEQMKIMEELNEDMAGILEYLLEKDGITCDVNSGNVEKVAMLLKDKVVDNVRDGARYIERYKGIKNMIYMLGKYVSDVKVLYNDLENYGYGDMKNEIEHLLKQAGLTVGTWNDWQGFGQFIEKCGFSMRNMTRTCKTGNNCIGVSEGVQIQEEYFDETELEKCQNETETQPMLNPPSTLDSAYKATLLTLSNAFNAFCNQSIIQYEYYTITNNDIGMVLAVNESNIEDVIIEQKKTNPDLNHNQMWRKEESKKDGYYLLVSKLYGRVLRVFDNTENQDTLEWKWTNTTKKIEGGSGFLSIDSNSCTAYKRDRNAIIVATVELNPTGNDCSQWDMKRTETDGFNIPIPATTTTSLAPSPSTEPPPRDIEEFLSRHNLQHLYSIFLQNAVTLNYLRKEELTREDMKELGINSLPDRKKLTAAIGTL